MNLIKLIFEKDLAKVNTSPHVIAIECFLSHLNSPYNNFQISNLYSIIKSVNLGRIHFWGPQNGLLITKECVYFANSVKGAIIPITSTFKCSLKEFEKILHTIENSHNKSSEYITINLIEYNNYTEGTLEQNDNKFCLYNMSETELKKSTKSLVAQVRTARSLSLSGMAYLLFSVVNITKKHDFVHLISFKANTIFPIIHGCIILIIAYSFGNSSLNKKALGFFYLAIASIIPFYTDTTFSYITVAAFLFSLYGFSSALTNNRLINKANSISVLKFFPDWYTNRWNLIYSAKKYPTLKNSFKLWWELRQERLGRRETPPYLLDQEKES